ncbi:nickel transport protein [Candidatus Magnetomoraceae bacterium gMMP-1]
MKQKIFNYLICIFFIPQIVAAHGTAYSILNDNNAVTLFFYYSDGEPMNYAEILILSPETAGQKSEQKIEYQNGRTDQKGRFAFYPDSAGTWLIEVNDGMGHKVSAEVEVKDTSGSNKENQAQDERVQPGNKCDQTPKSFKIILGLSLIFNLCSTAYLLKKKPTQS